MLVIYQKTFSGYAYGTAYGPKGNSLIETLRIIVKRNGTRLVIYYNNLALRKTSNSNNRFRSIRKFYYLRYSRAKPTTNLEKELGLSTLSSR